MKTQEWFSDYLLEKGYGKERGSNNMKYPYPEWYTTFWNMVICSDTIIQNLHWLNTFYLIYYLVTEFNLTTYFWKVSYGMRFGKARKICELNATRPLKFLLHL